MEIKHIKMTYERGQEYPYDAPDSWWEQDDAPPPPAIDWAHAAARGILKDLTDRRKIKQGFEEIDDEIRKEIVESLAEIIRYAHGQA